MKEILKVVVISLLITVISYYAVNFISFYIPVIPVEVWFALEMSFLITYLIVEYPKLSKREKKFKNRKEKIIYIIYNWIIVMVLLTGFNYIFTRR